MRGKTKFAHRLFAFFQLLLFIQNNFSRQLNKKLSAFSLNLHTYIFHVDSFLCKHSASCGRGEQSTNKQNQRTINMKRLVLPKSTSNLHQTGSYSVTCHCLLDNYASHPWLCSLRTTVLWPLLTTASWLSLSRDRYPKKICYILLPCLTFLTRKRKRKKQYSSPLSP